jgi:hypothetical protein
MSNPESWPNTFSSAQLKTLYPPLHRRRPRRQSRATALHPRPAVDKEPTAHPPRENESLESTPLRTAKPANPAPITPAAADCPFSQSSIQAPALGSLSRATNLARSGGPSVPSRALSLSLFGPGPGHRHPGTTRVFSRGRCRVATGDDARPTAQGLPQRPPQGNPPCLRCSASAPPPARVWVSPSSVRRRTLEQRCTLQHQENQLKGFPL